jgi:hypothetical protein
MSKCACDRVEQSPLVDRFEERRDGMHHADSGDRPGVMRGRASACYSGFVVLIFMALTPSQRLTLMKEIAQRLGNEEWPLVDTTLKQFSLPRSDPEPWTSTSAYVLRMIEDAGDNALVDLAYHLGFQLEQTGPPRIEPPRIEPLFWRKGMMRLFISHLASNRKFAAELQDALSVFGISAFVAHNDIEPTGKPKCRPPWPPAKLW